MLFYQNRRADGIERATINMKKMILFATLSMFFIGLTTSCNSKTNNNNSSNGEQNTSSNISTLNGTSWKTTGNAEEAMLLKFTSNTNGLIYEYDDYLRGSGPDGEFIYTFNAPNGVIYIRNEESSKDITFSINGDVLIASFNGESEAFSKM